VAKISGDAARAEAVAEARRKKDAGALRDLAASENPWAGARIATVPLDLAVTLATRRRNGGETNFLLAPDQRDVADALAADGNGARELPEGNVPLFYCDELTLPPENGETGAARPLFFRRGEVEEAWRSGHPGTEAPTIKVTELFKAVGEMVRPGATDPDLKELTFVPPKGSVKRAREIRKQEGEEVSFSLGQRIVVF